MAAVSVFDRTIYHQLFSTGAMEDIFGETATLQRLVDTERAVAKVQGALGIIPEAAASHIADRISADSIDLERLRDDTRIVGRPVVGLLKQLGEQVGPEYAQWIHHGLTTYDAMDTGKVLQIKEGLSEILNGVTRYGDGLKKLVADHRDTPMVARTNNLYALPTTFGAKLATWLEEMGRHLERLEAARDRVCVVQLGGAVGTLASLHPNGLKFRTALAKELGLGNTESTWHNTRDSMTEMMLCLGNLCASLARNAQNLSHLAGSDIGEISEAEEAGKGRSSSMAHKRNPRAAEFAEATARLGRQRASGILEVMGQDHERNGGTWIAEWLLVPETFLLTAGSLAWSAELVEGLEVHPDRMLENITSSNGLILSERYTLALATKIGKVDARRLIDEACAQVFATGTPLPDVLLGMDDVSKALSKEDIQAMADPQTYTGAAGDIVDNVLSAIGKNE